MAKNLTKVIAVLLATFLILTGCETSETSKQEKTTGPDGKSTLVINGDYTVPPTGHGNPFIGGYVNGIEPYMYDNLFVYAPFPKGEFKSHLGESYEFNNNVLKIKLKEGLKWSDGSALTTKDVETAYYMAFGRRQIWEYLESVNVVDDNNIELHFKNASPLILNMVFDIKMNAPQKVYGEWAEKYKELVDKREYHPETLTYWFNPEIDAKLQEINTDLENVKPDVTKVITSGPYTVDKFTTSEALLVKNPNYREDLSIDVLKVVRVTSPELAANAMIDGTLDIHSGGIVRDTEEQIINQVPDYKAYYVSEYSQMAVIFNTQKYPANKKEFRQAMAYLINKDELMPITEPGSLPSENTLTGLPVTLQEAWGVKDFADKELNPYTFDPEKAESILKGLGWTRNKDNKWVDDKGKIVEFELTCNAGWGSAMLPGEAIATRLNEFGITVNFRPMEDGAYYDYYSNGKHTVAIEFAPAGNVLYAHPYGTYVSLFKDRLNLMGLQPNKDGQVILESDGKEVNVTALTDKLFLAQGDEIKTITEQLMKVTHDNALFIPYLEKGFPIRTLKGKYQLDGVTPDDVIKDARFSGVGEDLFATLIKEGTIK